MKNGTLIKTNHKLFKQNKIDEFCGNIKLLNVLDPGSSDCVSNGQPAEAHQGQGDLCNKCQMWDKHGESLTRFSRHCKREGAFDDSTMLCVSL